MPIEELRDHTIPGQAKKIQEIIIYLNEHEQKSLAAFQLLKTKWKI